MCLYSTCYAQKKRTMHSIPVKKNLNETWRATTMMKTKQMHQFHTYCETSLPWRWGSLQNSLCGDSESVPQNRAEVIDVPVVNLHVVEHPTGLLLPLLQLQPSWIPHLRRRNLRKNVGPNFDGDSFRCGEMAERWRKRGRRGGMIRIVIDMRGDHVFIGLKLAVGKLAVGN